VISGGEILCAEPGLQFPADSVSFEVNAFPS
jgi:hypothetical protein